MSKFFRKVASAFVVMDEGPATAEVAGFEDIARDASSLLGQLEASTESSALPGEGVPAVTPASAVMEQTAEDVFRERGVKDTPNSALRVIKLIAGLSMFSRDQQVAMIRAMDAADDSWSEADVVKDAQQRQGVLRAHLSRLQQERAQRSHALAQEIELTRKNGADVLAELDLRIAELYARREQEASATATSVSKLEQREAQLDVQETRARQGIAQVIQALSSLLSFLGVPEGPENN